jgi:hypothetical protein
MLFITNLKDNVYLLSIIKTTVNLREIYLIKLHYPAVY